GQSLEAAGAGPAGAAVGWVAVLPARSARERSSSLGVQRQDHSGLKAPSMPSKGSWVKKPPPTRNATTTPADRTSAGNANETSNQSTPNVVAAGRAKNTSGCGNSRGGVIDGWLSTMVAAQATPKPSGPSRRSNQRARLNNSHHTPSRT